MLGLKPLKHEIAQFVRSQLIARPKPYGQAPVGDGPVVVAGLFSTASGIGQSARLCYKALSESGVDCLALDLSPAFNQVDLQPDIPLITKLPAGVSGTLIVHLNAPEIRHGLYHAGLRFGRKWRVVGYWAWELSRAPAGWAAAARHLTEIWTPSQFAMNAIRPVVDIPIKVVPHYVSVPSVTHPDDNFSNIARKDLTFLTVADGFSSFYRKNLQGAVAAYLEAFEQGDGHSLIVKCRNLHRFPEFQEEISAVTGSRTDVKLITETLDTTQMWGLMNSTDVLLSLHRAEGFGLHLAEAMALGKVVVGTDWSGNLSFMNSENSVLVPQELVPVNDPSGVYDDRGEAQWAQACVSTAAVKLREIAKNSEMRRSIGKKAQSDIQQKLTPFSYTEALSTGVNAPEFAASPSFAE